MLLERVGWGGVLWGAFSSNSVDRRAAGLGKDKDKGSSLGVTRCAAWIWLALHQFFCCCFGERNPFGGTCDTDVIEQIITERPLCVCVCARWW